LSTTLAPGLPIVHADAQLISRALHNLVSNALKFTEAGGTVEIITRVDDDKIEITVRDSGRGIPADEQPRLFQEYARGASSGSIEGTGLGLYIVRRSAEAHGGSVNVVSEVGEGSTFTLTLPSTPAAVTTSAGPGPLPRALA
jgi:signal transduction histidine kinase